MPAALDCTYVIFLALHKWLPDTTDSILSQLSGKAVVIEDL